MKNRVNNSLFNKQLVNASFVESFRKLDPRVMIKNPIMFTVEVVTFVMLLLIVWIAVTGNTSQGSLGYNIVIFLVLLATVLFANFAEAIAGLLASKKYVPESAGTLKTDTFTFSLMTFAVIIIVAALSFFPAQALGPIADYLSF